MKKNEEIYATIIEKVNDKILDNESVYSVKESFLRWAFELVEETSSDDLEVINEEFKALDVSIDGFYSDYDEDDMIIMSCDYYTNPTINYEVDEQRYQRILRKLSNFINAVYERKYISFGTTSSTYEIADRISNSDKNIIVKYFTNMIVPSSLKDDITIDVRGRSILVNFVDLSDFEDYLSEKEDAISIDFAEIAEPIEAINVSSTKDFDVYLFVIQGYLLAKLYEKYGLSLLDSNVRSYLKKSQKVNKGIWTTINEAPSEFLAYNNGLSTVATGGEIKKIKDKYCKINILHDWQIVNGGQTTATIFEALNDRLELKEVLVPVKLTVIKNINTNFDLIQSISLYANTQTAINKSDLSSNDPYYIDLDRISRKLSWNGEYHWFFERNRGQYLAYKRRSKNSKKFEKENPPKYKFTKTDIAKSIVSWQSMPQIVALGREKNFIFFNDHVRNQIIKVDEDYYKNIVGALILFREVDKIVRNQKLEFKANVVSYTIAKISYDLDKCLDLIEIWKNQKLSQELTELIYKTTIKVRDKLIDSPINYKNIPMWARKDECWESIRLLQLPFILHVKSKKKIDFFPINFAQKFIEDKKNYEDESTWTKLIIWNATNKILSNKQMGLIKRIETCTRYQTNITDRLKKQAIDIFLLSVKHGYEYGGE